METAKSAIASVGVFIRAIVTGLAIALVGGSPLFALVIPLNGQYFPEVPWVAALNLILLGLLLAWLNGWGPPRFSAEFRRHSLRLWRPSESRPRRGALGTVLIIGAIVAIYGYYIIVATMFGPPADPDVSNYPTTATRLSAFIMGALLSGVGEEAAFRGYMQSQLERFGAPFAIIVTSIVFTLAHVTHGAMFIRLAAGYFILSVLWGLLALRTGSILPGMILHVVGDLLVAYFVVLGGDGTLLLAS